MYQVTIVIPNYNGEEYLYRCLGSIPQTDDIEIIVVDNGSTDGSVQLIQKHFDRIHLIQNERNEGFSIAVNEGIRASNAPYVILLNNDTQLEENFVDILLKAMDKHPKAFSCSSCMVTMKDPTVIDDTGDFYCTLGWAFTLGKGRKKQNYSKSRFVFSSCAGAAIYRKEVFAEIGYFDENHFAYLEDVDLGFRSIINGWKNVYIPEAVCRHVGSGYSGSKYNPFKICLSAQNSIYIIYKNMPFLMFLLNLPFLLLGFVIKFFFFLIKGYGKDYLKGIGAGFKLCRSASGKLHKVRFKWKNIFHYCMIQLQLWFNVIRKMVNS